jgi:hypothetical protein
VRIPLGVREGRQLARPPKLPLASPPTPPERGESSDRRN